MGRKILTPQTFFVRCRPKRAGRGGYSESVSATCDLRVLPRRYRGLIGRDSSAFCVRPIWCRSNLETWKALLKSGICSRTC